MSNLQELYNFIYFVYDSNLNNVFCMHFMLHASSCETVFIADINASADERQQESVVSGRLLRLACNVHGLPPPHIVWSRDGVDLLTANSLRLVRCYLDQQHRSKS